MQKEKIETNEIPEIRNSLGELLDVSFEGKEISEADRVMVLTHGFGTDKHERGIFDDISENLTKNDENLSIIRYTNSGYGESEGDQKTKSLETMKDDLASVLAKVNEIKQSETKINLVGFSMGSHVLSRYLSEASGKDIENVVIVNPPGLHFKDRIQEYFRSKSEIDEDGVWTAERKDGTKTQIGPAFWESLDGNLLKKNMKSLTEKYSVTFVRAINDDVVTENTAAVYRDMHFKKIVGMPGNHNYSKPEDRERFLSVFKNLIPNS